MAGTATFVVRKLTTASSTRIIPAVLIGARQTLIPLVCWVWLQLGWEQVEWSRTMS